MTAPRKHQLNQGGSHMTRVVDDAMSPRYRKGHWLGLVRCRRPTKDREVIFVDDAGNMIGGDVLGVTSSGWRVGQFHGEPRYTVRRLSCSRWRPAWRVVAVYLTADAGAFREAIALGLYDRAKAILAAWRGRRQMPPPLSDAQQQAAPRILKAR